MIIWSDHVLKDDIKISADSDDVTTNFRGASTIQSFRLGEGVDWKLCFKSWGRIIDFHCKVAKIGSIDAASEDLEGDFQKNP